MDSDQVIQFNSSPKILYLLRHSDAESNSVNFNDFQRKLSAFGRKKAHAFSTKYASELTFDMVFCSNALRTKETLGLLELTEIDTKFSDRLYLAEKEELISEIERVPREINKLLIVGHNNGLSDLLGYLTGTTLLLSTCQMVEIKLETNDWTLLGKETGSLLRNFY